RVIARARERISLVDTIADIFAAAALVAADGRGKLHVPARLQSWPGIVHGGGVVALLDWSALTLGAHDGPRSVDVRLTSSVPVDTALVLEGEMAADVVRLTVLEGGQTLSAGAVSRLGPREAAMREAWRGGATGWSLPVSDHCLACGALNPLGLR